jgi:hypothetical protein
MNYVYLLESVERLRRLSGPLLPFVRHFGPPTDHPHPMLETVRKQLPVSRVVYKLECLRRPSLAALENGNRVLLRIPVRNEVFAELTRVEDGRSPENGVVYFGVDDAVSPTNRQSPNLYLPSSKVGVLVAGGWMPLSFPVIAALAHMDGRAARLVA